MSAKSSEMRQKKKTTKADHLTYLPFETVSIERVLCDLWLIRIQNSIHRCLPQLAMAPNVIVSLWTTTQFHYKCMNNSISKGMKLLFAL